MSLKTVPVRVRLTGPNGTLKASARVTATLSNYEVDDGIVLPLTVTANTNRAGVAILNLWPNSRGSASSSYQIEALDADGNSLLDVNVVVPDSSTGTSIPVESIINQAPFPSIDASQQALVAIQTARSEVEASRQASGQFAENAAASLADANTLMVTVTAAYVSSVANTQELRALFVQYIEDHP